MSYKILTKNGIDNTNIDGARGEYFNSGMRDGIVQGALNEGLFTATASNIISLDTCELRIAGHRIVIDEPVYHTFTNAPSADTRYAFVAQIVVDDNQNVDFSLFVQTVNTPLIQNDLYKNITGAGTYQIEIGRFTLLTSLTIEDVVRTIDVITGGTGKGSGASINIGNVTTNTLDPDVDAEVDVSERYEEDEGKEYLDFTFGIPKAEVNIDTELSITSENAVQNKVITNALNEKLGNNGEQILNGTLEVTTETADEPSVTVDKSVTIVDKLHNTSKTTTNIAQLNTSGLAIEQIEETTTSSGSDTVTKEIQYGLSGITLNYSTIVDIDDNGVFNFSNKPTVSNESGASEELVSESQVVRTDTPQSLTNAEKQQAQANITHTALQNHATSGVQVGWYQVANLKTQGNYDIKIKQAYNYELPEAIHLSISINNRLYTGESFASITQLSGVKPSSFALSKIRVRQGTDEGTTFLDVYNPDQLWNTTWVDIASDSQNDVVVETNSPFQFIGTEDNPSGYKISSLDLVNGFNTSNEIYRNGQPLAQLPKEYAVQVNTGDAAEYIHIGSFPIYDTNITVDISCTSTSILTGRVVFSCTNHVVNTAYVYGDPYREISSRLFYSLQNNTIDLYFQAPTYQKMMYKVWYDTAWDSEPTVDGARLSTLPATATNTIPNALDRTSQLRVGGTVATLGVVSNLNTISQPVNSTVTYTFGGGCTNAPTTDSGMVIQMQESTAYCTQLVIANDENASTWRRSYRDGTWQEWKQMNTNKDEKKDDVLIYDMDSEDENVNRGFTSGMKGTNYIRLDFSQFKKIRIYARLYNANAVQEFFVKNRKLPDMTLTGVSATPTVISFLKVQMNLEPYLDSFQVMAYAKYVFSTGTGTFTLDFGMANDSFYVYRIEGIV